MTPTTIAIAVERVHRMLDKLGIPDVADDARGWSHLTKRMKLVQMYMDGIRGKYLRSKKRERAMSRILNGPETKKKEATYGALAKKVAEYESRDKRITVELSKHFAVRPNLATRWPHELPETIQYLVHRSNQLQANDSLAVQEERKRTAKVIADAKQRAESAEQRSLDVRKHLDYYIATFGLKHPPRDWDWSAEIMDNPHLRDAAIVSIEEAQQMVDTTLADLRAPVRTTSEFPWRRGNPGYLADYTTDELLDEIRRRTTHVR